MIPLIDKKQTGINLRRIMDECGFTVKDVQQYSKCVSLVKWDQYAICR